MKKTPITLLTGFLGSGKTTVINRFLKSSQLEKVVVIINEFGEIGIDHDLILHSKDSTYLLTNGCLCCTVKSDLINTLRELIMRSSQGLISAFDRVIVETTGLADPSAIIQALLTDLVISKSYQLDGVFTTVDAVNIETTLANHFEAVKQISVADNILVTKVDVTKDGDATLGVLVDRIREINLSSLIYKIDDRAKLDEIILCKREASPAYAAVGHGHDDHHCGHVHTWSGEDGTRRICSFSVYKDEPFSLDDLDMFIRALSDTLGPNLLRLKSIINIAEAPDTPAVLEGAQKILHDVRWMDNWPSEDHRSRFVFITEGIDRSVILELFEMVERLRVNQRKLLRA